MKVTAITLRAGHVVEYNGKLCVVVKNEIIQPGKGNSVAQVEMRDIRTGNKDNVRYRTQETVERLRLDQEDYQYLYTDADGINLMNQQTFEQITARPDLVIGEAAFLQEGMIVEVESYEGEVLGITLPVNAVYEIVEAEPVVKGQTATTSYKPAILDCGVRIMVPPHIESGTRVVVKLEDSTYIERAKD